MESGSTSKSVQFSQTSRALLQVLVIKSYFLLSGTRHIASTGLCQHLGHPLAAQASQLCGAVCHSVHDRKGAAATNASKKYPETMLPFWSFSRRMLREEEMIWDLFSGQMFLCALADTLLDVGPRGTSPRCA